MDTQRIPADAHLLGDLLLDRGETVGDDHLAVHPDAIRRVGFVLEFLPVMTSLAPSREK